MKKLKFNIDINAPKEKVWNSLWNDENYREWTSVFSPGSYAETDWNEGSNVKFLSPSGDGMFSTIEKKVPNSYMAFKHLGVVKNFEDQPADEESKKWSGALETYTLNETDGVTGLTVEVDITEGFEQYMTDTFPQALEKVKSIAEK